MYKKWGKQITAMVMALTVLLSAAGVFAADASDTILSENFEGNNAMWQISASGGNVPDVTFDTTTTHGEGATSMKMTNGTSVKTFTNTNGEDYEPGVYTFTCWIYATGDVMNAFSATSFTKTTAWGADNTDTTVVEATSITAPYNTWVKVRKKVTIAEGQKSIYMSFVGRGNTYYVDDISITKGYVMIENGGFEDDLNGGWKLGSKVNGHIAVSTDKAHSGTKALKVHANEATDNGADVSAMYLAAVEPGKTYTVSFWLYGEEGLTLADSLNVVLRKNDSYANYGDTSPSVKEQMTPTKTVTGKWIKLSGSITATEDAKYLQLMFIKRVITVPYYIDDVVIEEDTTGIRLEKNDEGTLYGLDAVEAGDWQVTGHLVGEDASAMVVAAVYKVSGEERSLVHVAIQPATAAEDGIATVTVEGDGEYEIKAMMWAPGGGLTPITRPITLS